MTTTRWNGAHRLLRAARARGIDICFANPGTTELTLVAALDDVLSIRPVLGLFEGVCTGAADGYARVSGKPALTLLHLGPGLANGLANLHNARRARSPVVNIVGDHATWHLPFDAPLTSDIDSFAKPVSKAVIYLRDAASLPAQLQEAFDIASGPNGAVVTVIAPTDVMDAEVAEATSPSPTRPSGKGAVSDVAVDAAAAALSRGGPLILLLGADALTERGQRAAARVAGAVSARLLMESYPAIVSLGGDLPRLERLAYFPQDVLKQVGEATVVLVGAKAPVSYFGYEGQPSALVQSDRIIELSRPDEDSVAALEALAARMEAPALAAETAATPAVPSDAGGAGPLSPVDVVDDLIDRLPEGAIISLEGSTLGGPFLQRAYRARKHRVMTNTGGAIGQGLPCATGAALAAPGVRVVSLQSDGSAQYTVQSLWTIAREKLPVTVIIAANHRYGILQTELKRADASIDGDVTGRLTRLDNPRVDWTALAQGYGVPATRVASRRDLQLALKQGFDEVGPFLIQVDLP